MLSLGTKFECEKKQNEVEDEIESESTTNADKENHKPTPKQIEEISQAGIYCM